MPPWRVVLWPIAIHCPPLGPFPSIGGGAHQPHHPVSFLFLLALSFPPYFLFLSLGFSLRRPWYPSASHHPVSFLFLLAHSFPLQFPLLFLGWLCQRSPRIFPVSLLYVESTQRRATALAVGQVHPSGHPKPAVRGPLPNTCFWGGVIRKCAAACVVTWVSSTTCARTRSASGYARKPVQRTCRILANRIYQTAGSVCLVSSLFCVLTSQRGMVASVPLIWGCGADSCFGGQNPKGGDVVVG